MDCHNGHNDDFDGDHQSQAIKPILQHSLSLADWIAKKEKVAEVKSNKLNFENTSRVVTPCSMPPVCRGSSRRRRTMREICSGQIIPWTLWDLCVNLQMRSYNVIEDTCAYHWTVGSKHADWKGKFWKFIGLLMDLFDTLSWQSWAGQYKFIV